MRELTARNERCWVGVYRCLSDGVCGASGSAAAHGGRGRRATEDPEHPPQDPEALPSAANGATSSTDVPASAAAGKDPEALPSAANGATSSTDVPTGAAVGKEVLSYRYHAKRYLAKALLLELAAREGTAKEATARRAQLRERAIAPDRAFSSPEPRREARLRQLRRSSAPAIHAPGVAASTGAKSSTRHVMPAMVLPRWESLEVLALDTIDVGKLQIPAGAPLAPALCCTVCQRAAGAGEAILALPCAHAFCPRCFEVFLRHRWAALAAQEVAASEKEQIPCPACGVNLLRQDVHTLTGVELSFLCRRALEVGGQVSPMPGSRPHPASAGLPAAMAGIYSPVVNIPAHMPHGTGPTAASRAATLSPRGMSRSMPMNTAAEEGPKSNTSIPMEDGPKSNTSIPMEDRARRPPNFVRNSQGRGMSSNGHGHQTVPAPHPGGAHNPLRRLESFLQGLASTPAPDSRQQQQPAQYSPAMTSAGTLFTNSISGPPTPVGSARGAGTINGVHPWQQHPALAMSQRPASLSAAIPQGTGAVVQPRSPTSVGSKQGLSPTAAGVSDETRRA